MSGKMPLSVCLSIFFPIIYLHSADVIPSLPRIHVCISHVMMMLLFSCCIVTNHFCYSLCFCPLCTQQATNPYLTGMPQVGSTFSPYFTPGPVMPAILGPDPTSVGSPISVVPQTVVTQQKMARSDRLEVSDTLQLFCKFFIFRLLE
jgi:hypothetical protein